MAQADVIPIGVPEVAPAPAPRAARPTVPDEERTAPGATYQDACAEMRDLDETAAGAAAFERDQLHRAQRLLALAFALMAAALALAVFSWQV